MNQQEIDNLLDLNFDDGKQLFEADPELYHELQSKVRRVIKMMTKGNTTVDNINGHPVPHPDNSRPSLDMLQFLYAENTIKFAKSQESTAILK